MSLQNANDYDHLFGVEHMYMFICRGRIFTITHRSSSILTTSIIRSIRSQISCKASNSTIYEAPNGVKYLITSGIGHIDSSIRDPASSWQSSYESCALSCSGSADCLSLAYGPSFDPGVNCWLESYSDHITDQHSPTSTSSTSSTTCRVYDVPSSNKDWDVCNATPSQRTDASSCKPPYPDVPELQITFNPRNEQQCNYYPEYPGQERRRGAPKSLNVSVAETQAGLSWELDWL
ncbi:hypothetical protein B0H67DRAFT_671476 [Lasiosphaeris hirsuta]|uniref:Uncharacterized protein n=1 Tax=Lasiosphaeris hirsuta TaxID=260670 RepID=A0AA40A210_9PEZI|nr:hypothetical protein B0H67DRAFT_671476 [Lasiosphaeris hirsuta]